MADDDYSSSTSEKDDFLGKIFFKKYQIIKKLGEGSFGKIYEASYKDEHFALKFEDKNSNSNLLEGEASIMNYLKGPNIPQVKSFGTSGHYNILIMQLMGKSLEDLINEKRTFSIKTVCLLGYQMITILEYIHNKHIVHRDIKPDNFVLGLNSLAKNLYLLDFGLARKYRSSTTLLHYPLINKKKLTGTARYASINALRGDEQSRRDDLEAVGYVLMYFLRGSLPWQGLPGKNKDDRYKNILQKKIDTSPSELCRGFPQEFEKYIEYTRKMKYEEQPLYDILRGYFKKVVENENEYFDYIYDWSTEEEKKLRKKEFVGDMNGRKSRKTSSFLGEEQPLLKNGKGENGKKNDLNNEEGKNKNYDLKKYDEIIHRNRNQDIKLSKKINTKIASKENSIERNNNNYNNNSFNERRHSYGYRNNNNYQINGNRRNNNREEVCCSEACKIF